MYSYPLNSWGVCSKCCSKCSSAVKWIIKVCNILSNNDRAHQFFLAQSFLTLSAWKNTKQVINQACCTRLLQHYHSVKFKASKKILKSKSSFSFFDRETCCLIKIIPNLIASFLHYRPVSRYFEKLSSSVAGSIAHQTWQMLNSGKRRGKLFIRAL